MKKISIGSWAYVFNQVEEISFHSILHRLHDLGLDGVELGAFGKHPTPESHDTKAKRQALKKEVADHGLAFSGLGADLWSQKLLSVEDSGPYVAAFAKNLFFADDLGIDLIRVDSVEPPTVLEKIDPKVAFDRAVRVWDLCAKLAANRGVRVCWEFEPGFAFNKPSEIVAMVDAVRGRGNPNFGALFDTCHAHMCAAVGANQVGPKETLPGGALELLEKLKGKITHVHLIDSDNTLNEHNTSTHAPFGKGVLNFDELLPALNKAGVPGDWWCIDLCFWPDAWSVTADSVKYLDAMRQKYAMGKN
jgi:sugar phosphate isomerase/epimerase